MMITWYAQFQLRGHLTQQQIDDLADHGGVTTARLHADRDQHEVRLTVEAADYEQALTAAVAAFRVLLIAAAVAVESVTVQTREVHDRDLDVIGAAEAADILGVSGSRLRQLRSRPDAPKPVATLAGGALYRRTDVVEFASHARPQGRPRKTAA